MRRFLILITHWICGLRLHYIVTSLELYMNAVASYYDRKDYIIQIIIFRICIPIRIE